MCLLLILFHVSVGSLPLPWSIRLKIALGAAKGLAFLHEEAEKPVIYRDFKTSNILLDAVHYINLRMEINLLIFRVAQLIPYISKCLFSCNIIEGLQCKAF